MAQRAAPGMAASVVPKKKRAKREEKPAPQGPQVLRDAAVALAVFAAPLLWTAPPIVGATARKGQAIVTALLWLAWLAHLWDGLVTQRRLRLPRLSLLLPALAVVAAAAISCITSVNRDASVLFTLQLLAGVMLFALVAQRENRRMRAWAAPALALSAVAGAIYGLRSYVLEWAAGGAVWRTFGPFFNPNLFAGFLAIVIPLAAVLAANAGGTLRECLRFVGALLIVALMLTGARLAGVLAANAKGTLRVCYGFACAFLVVALMLTGARLARVLAANAKCTLRVCYGFACVLLIAALMLTGSRGGWMAFVVGALVLCVGVGVALRRARWGIAAAAVALILLAGMALAVAPLRTRLLSSFSGQEHSNRFRVLTWQATVRIIEHHPVLGSGPGTFEYVFPKYAIAGFTRMAHQNYLQVAAENGVAGLVCFAWLLFALVAAAGASARRAESVADRMIAAACLSGLAAFIVHSLLDYTWFVGGIAATVWLLGAMAAGSYRQSLMLHAPGYGSRRMWAFSATAVVLSLLTAIAVRAGIAEGLALQGQQALRAGDRYRSIESFRSAAAWEPGNGAYRRLLGWTLGQGEGVAEMRQAIALEPTNPIPHAWLARMLKRAGGLEGAKAEFRQAVALNPNFTAAYRDIAEIAMSQKNFGEARQAYLDMVRIEQSPYGQVSALEQMVETDYAFAHYGLGLLANGDAAGARAEFERALQIIQDFEARGKGTTRLLEEMGQADPSRSADVQLLKGKVLWRLAGVARAAGDTQAEQRFRAQAGKADGAARLAVSEEDALLADKHVRKSG